VAAGDRVVARRCGFGEVEVDNAFGNGTGEPGRAGRGYCWRIERTVFFAVGRRLGLHHQTVRRCVERAVAEGPMAAFDDRPRPGKEPMTPLRPRHGWCRWRVGRQRNWVIRTNFGRHGFWPTTPASMDRRRGMRASPGWPRARSARSSTRRTSSRTKCATTSNAAIPTLRKRWPKCCAFIARSNF
jgi:hypothetical protein